jgi:glycerol uptake facilitator-like aquaporin
MLQELLATFIFVLIALVTKNPYIIALTLLIILLASSKLIVNPSVSIGAMLSDELTSADGLIIVGAEIAGALLAGLLYLELKRQMTP